MSIHRTLSKLFASCPSSHCLSLTQHPAQESGSISSPTSVAQSQIQFLPSERKAVLQSGQWYPGCWARSFEFHFAVGAGPQRCQEALSSLGHHRGAGPTVVHAEKWSYSGSVGNIQSSISFPSNSLTFSSRIFLAVTKRGKKVYQI